MNRGNVDHDVTIEACVDSLESAGEVHARCELGADRIAAIKRALTGAEGHTARA